MSGLDASQPVGGGDEYVQRCEIPEGGSGCVYDIEVGGTTLTGSFRQDQQPQPQPPAVVSQGSVTLDVSVVEGIRFSSNDTRRQGFNSPNYFRTRDAGAEEWVNLYGMAVASDGTQAIQRIGGTLGKQIVAQDFGFRIPLASSIARITIEIDRSAIGEITDESASLIVCGAESGGAAQVMFSAEVSNVYLLDAASGSVLTTQAQSDFAVATDSAGNFYSAVGGQLTKYGPDFSVLWTLAIDVLVAVDENDRVFIAEPSATSSPLYVKRLNPDTGATLWATDAYDVGIGGGQNVFALQATGGNVMAARFNPGTDAVFLLDVSGAITDTISITSTNKLALAPDGHVYEHDASESGGELSRLTSPTWSVFVPGEPPPASITRLIHDPVNNTLYARNNQDIQRYSTTDGSLIWSVTKTGPEDLGLDDSGNLYVSLWDDVAGVAKIIRIDPSNGATVWTSPAVGDNSSGVITGYGGSSTELVNLLLDEGRVTDAGTYSCALTPLTTISSTARKLVLSIDDASAWTPEQINDISFGVTYSSAGSGVVIADAVRIAVDYFGAFGESLPAKRPKGLSGVTVSSWGRRVVVGVNGKILWSDDGLTWTPADSGTNATLLDVVWAKNRYVAVGRGIILESGDAEAWSRIIGPPEALYDVDYNRLNRKVIALGENGVQAMPSKIGEPWLTRYS